MRASTEDIASLPARVPAFARLAPQARVPAFARLAPQELAEAAAVAVPRSFAPREAAFREGDASSTCSSSAPAMRGRAGVISRGRGRLTVHDPAALDGYVY